MPNANNSEAALPKILAPGLIRAASLIAGFKLQKAEFASARNVSGVRTEFQTFSQRHDSRTVFAVDLRYGYGRQAGVWTGIERTAMSACRRSLQAAGIPTKEVQKVVVISEMGQVAERRPDGEVRIHDPAVIRKLARATRSVGGIPVWSSYATLGLTRTEKVGSLEIHWPELPKVILEEAKLLQLLVKKGFTPPEVPSARVEIVETGIIHSGAIGFLMEIVPCIRVIYRGDDPGVGRKPVLYLDRHKESVPTPRDLQVIDPELNERPKPNNGGTKR
jgi:hypothetical protein